MITKEFLTQIYEESLDLAIEVAKIEVKWAVTIMEPLVEPLVDPFNNLIEKSKEIKSLTSFLSIPNLVNKF